MKKFSTTLDKYDFYILAVIKSQSGYVIESKEYDETTGVELSGTIVLFYHDIIKFIKNGLVTKCFNKTSSSATQTKQFFPSCYCIQTKTYLSYKGLWYLFLHQNRLTKK